MDALLHEDADVLATRHADACNGASRKEYLFGTVGSGPLLGTFIHIYTCYRVYIYVYLYLYIFIGLFLFSLKIGAQMKSILQCVDHKGKPLHLGLGGQGGEPLYLGLGL